jgi:hypothetical protein
MKTKKARPYIIKTRRQSRRHNSRKRQGEDKMKLVNELLTEKYTYVEHEDDIKFNAPHHFKVKRKSDNEIVGEINFQCGPIKESGVNGVNNEDLLNMVAERLRGFQNSQFNCRENACALTKIEKALMWMRKRTTARELRNVEGTNTV